MRLGWPKARFWVICETDAPACERGETAASIHYCKHSPDAVLVEHLLQLLAWEHAFYSYGIEGLLHGEWH